MEPAVGEKPYYLSGEYEVNYTIHTTDLYGYTIMSEFFEYYFQYSPTM